MEESAEESAEVADNDTSISDIADSRPANESQGVLAIWAIYKCICILFDGDQCRRGEAHDALLREAALTDPLVRCIAYKALRGNREQAWLHNAREVARYVTDRAIGCAHCSVCREKHPDLCACVEHEDGARDTHGLCVVCYLKNKRVWNSTRTKLVKSSLNKLEKAVIEYLTSWRCLVEWVALGVVEEQIIAPILKRTAKLCVMDAIDVAKIVSTGLASLEDDSAPVVRGAKRALDDGWVADWEVDAGVQKQFYVEALLRTSNRLLFKLHASMRPVSETIRAAFSPPAAPDAPAPEPQPAQPAPVGERPGVDECSRFLERCVTHLLASKLPNTPANWLLAVDAAWNRNTCHLAVDWRITLHPGINLVGISSLRTNRKLRLRSWR